MKPIRMLSALALAMAILLPFTGEAEARSHISFGLNIGPSYPYYYPAYPVYAYPYPPAYPAYVAPPPPRYVYAPPPRPVYVAPPPVLYYPPYY